MSGKTLYDKIWDAHLVQQDDDGTCLLYIDRHLVHEVTSPQAFEGLRMTGRTVRAPQRTIAVPDHNVPTTVDRENGIENEESRIQVEALDKNAKDFGVNYYPVSDVRQGIVHIVGPEQGWTLPGMTVVCGDSHTATHGAFGSIAIPIGGIPPVARTMPPVAVTRSRIITRGFASVTKSIIRVEAPGVAGLVGLTFASGV